MHIFCIWGARLKRVPSGGGSGVIKFEPQHFPILWSQLDLKTLKNQFQHKNPTGIHVDPHYFFHAFKPIINSLFQMDTFAFVCFNERQCLGSYKQSHLTIITSRSIARQWGGGWRRPPPPPRFPHFFYWFHWFNVQYMYMHIKLYYILVHEFTSVGGADTGLGF